MVDLDLVDRFIFNYFTTCDIQFQEWKRKERRKQEAFVDSLTKVFNEALESLVFKAWANVTAEARRTREYFEVMEDFYFFDSI